jgi:hypothetical protein
MKEIATLWLERARRIHTQRPKDKNKLYALHAPEVECIGKGKARQPYEFGVKVGIATTEKGNLIVGARAFPGNPYDGHTLAEQIEQATILMQDVKGAPKPHTAIVDLGYRGVEVPGSRSSTGPDQEPERQGASSAQTASGGGARDRTPEGRLRATAELAERIGRGCAAPGAVCRRVQPALADAGGGPSGAEGPFCALASGRDAWAGGQQRACLAVRLAAGAAN